MSGSYTVRAGDTLSAIAARNGIGLAQLEAANSQIADPDLIHPGDKVRIPERGSGKDPAQQPPSAAKTPTTYRVEAGDTLSEIAGRFRTTVAQLASKNGIADPDLIRAGATLSITGTAPRRTASGSGSGSDRVRTPAADSGDRSLRGNARLVARIARDHGADPLTAVAVMLVESGGDERVVGDNGTSFGLFQLHRGGMLTAAGLTKEQAFDPATNARVAVASLARTEDRRGRSGGATAAASQRPADPSGYARKVDAQRDHAAALIS